MHSRRNMPSSLSDYRMKVDQILSRRKIAIETVKREKSALADAEQHLQDAMTAQQLVQDVAQTIQATAHQRIARIVTRCLQAVFGDRYKFYIDFRRLRGKTEARLLFLDKSGNEIDPAEDCAGGAVDVAALGLRLAALMLSRPHKRRLLCLDEPLRFLHGTEHQERARDMLLMLSEEFGIQLIIVTGENFLRMGEVIDLGESDH